MPPIDAEQVGSMDVDGRASPTYSTMDVTEEEAREMGLLDDEDDEDEEYEEDEEDEEAEARELDELYAREHHHEVGNVHYNWLDPSEAVRTIYVGTCTSNGTDPVFAEASYTDGKLPRLDASRDGVRLVTADGQEHDYFIPNTWLLYRGAIVEMKKYLYGLAIEWFPLTEVKRDIARDVYYNHHNGWIHAVIVDYLQGNGVTEAMPSSVIHFMSPSRD
ncbi:hypothetical protein GGR57DRAFT_498760 [Xylariaceae sp. FL1272]|nr:hypothetical protein GGR57DRAFT_498760 [Xylariaceae sp. FL1272]